MRAFHSARYAVLALTLGTIAAAPRSADARPAAAPVMAPASVAVRAGTVVVFSGTDSVVALVIDGLVVSITIDLLPASEPAPPSACRTSVMSALSDGFRSARANIKHIPLLCAQPAPITRPASSRGI